MAPSTNICVIFYIKDIKKEHQCFFQRFGHFYSVLDQENEFPVINLRSRGETPYIDKLVSPRERKLITGNSFS